MDTNRNSVFREKLISKLIFVLPFIILMVGGGIYYIVIPNIHDIIEIKIIWRIWLAAFTFTLFLVGKKLHQKPQSNNANSLLIKKEPYFLMKDMNNYLKQLEKCKNRQLASLRYSMKRLEERFSIESDFGCGDNTVISVENDIAKQIQDLIYTIQLINNENIDASINDMNKTVKNINILLCKRIELKKHHNGEQT